MGWPPTIQWVLLVSRAGSPRAEGARCWEWAALSAGSCRLGPAYITRQDHHPTRRASALLTSPGTSQSGFPILGLLGLTKPLSHPLADCGNEERPGLWGVHCSSPGFSAAAGCPAGIGPSGMAGSKPPNQKICGPVWFESNPAPRLLQTPQHVFELGRRPRQRLPSNLTGFLHPPHPPRRCALLPCDA